MPSRMLARAVLCLTAVGCTPALNWREVHIGNLQAMLPCKPDQAERPVDLGGAKYSMQMQGCEAAGALFAISRVQAPDTQQTPQLLGALRAASLATVQSEEVVPQANSGDASSSLNVLVRGKRPEGGTLHVRYRWLVHGNDVYQLAVYADTLRTEQTETLMGEVRFP